MELDYRKTIIEIEKAIEDQNTAVLATSLGDRVTARSISIVNIGLTILFQTDSRMEKMEQIRENPNVSLCMSNMQIEGRAKVLGKASEQKDFIDRYRDKHDDAWRKYSDSEYEIVVAVEMERMKIWNYVDGRPTIEEIDFLNHIAELHEYEKF